MLLLRLRKTNKLTLNKTLLSVLLRPSLSYIIDKPLNFFTTSKKLFGQKVNPTKQQPINDIQTEQQTRKDEIKKQQIPKTRPKWAQNINPLINQHQHKKQHQSSIKNENKYFDNKQSNKKQQFLHPKQQAQQFLHPKQQAQQFTSHNNKSPYIINNNQPIKRSFQQNQSYNLRSCQMILYQFKDIAKQSKQLKSLIKSFYQYKTKLREQNVQMTKLKLKHMSIMYSAMMRAFARILRREINPDRAAIVQFLGQDYQNISTISLEDLKTLQLSDFVSFFFIFELMGSYRSISQEKRKVVERYLKSLYERYKQNKGMRSKQNEKQLAMDEQKMQKRYMSQVILGARCAQLFTSLTYQCYLDLIINHISTQKLVPYKMVSILKFIMRRQNHKQEQQQRKQVYHIRKQMVLLQKIIQKIQNSNVLLQMDVVSLRQMYGNLVAIMGNHNGNSEDNNNKINNIDVNKQAIANTLMQRLKHVIVKIQQHLIQTLYKFPAQQIHHITSYSLTNNLNLNINQHNHSYKLTKHIYHNIFNNINQQGQTSMNPLFIIMMASNLNKKVIQMISLKEEVDPLWQRKIVNLVKRYLIIKQQQKQNKLNNLSYCTEYIAKLVKNIQQVSEQLYNLLIQSIINKELIIPYDYQTLLIQNYYLSHFQNNLSLVYATLYRLKNAISYGDKKVNLYDRVFKQLQCGITSKQKNKIVDQHKVYIQSMGQIKKNRQGYVRTISKLCTVLKKEQLISQVFNQSLLRIINFNTIQNPSTSTSKKHHNNNYKNQTRNKQNIFLTKQQQLKLGYKDRQKIYSLICNYFTVMLKLKTNIVIDSSKQIKQDNFIQSIGVNHQIQKLFLQALTSKETGEIMCQYYDPSKINYLINVAHYLINKKSIMKYQQKDIDSTRQSQRVKQFYLQLQKNYPTYLFKDIQSFCQIKKIKQ